MIVNWALIITLFIDFTETMQLVTVIKSTIIIDILNTTIDQLFVAITICKVLMFIIEIYYIPPKSLTSLYRYSSCSNDRLGII